MADTSNPDTLSCLTDDELDHAIGGEVLFYPPDPCTITIDFSWMGSFPLCGSYAD